MILNTITYPYQNNALMLSDISCQTADFTIRALKQTFQQFKMGQSI